MLVHLRRATTHGVLACWLGVDCSAISRAVAEVWSLLAERGAPLARVCGCGPWP
ncbi:transposase family protein [Streptomyces tendae]|uniref:transposase family protein n=1 Tax=Streptomyces tendae TaxID=1932 RepID=UPI00371D43EF